MGASGTGTSGQADTAEEVGLDRTHPQEARGGSLMAYAPLGAMDISKYYRENNSSSYSVRNMLKLLLRTQLEHWWIAVPVRVLRL